MHAKLITGIAENKTKSYPKTAGFGGFCIFLRDLKIRNSRRIGARRLLALGTALPFARLLAVCDFVVLV